MTPDPLTLEEAIKRCEDRAKYLESRLRGKTFYDGMSATNPTMLMQTELAALRAVVREVRRLQARDTTFKSLVQRLWGDPEDCEDCADIKTRPCEIHGDSQLADEMEHEVLGHPRAKAGR